MKRILAAVAAILLLFLLLAAAPGRAGTASAVAPWKCLDYSAERFFLRGRAHLCVEAAGREDLEAWNHSGDRWVPPKPQPSFGEALLELRVEADLAGSQTTDEILFEPTGRVLQRSKLKLGSEPHRKSFRFGKDGVAWTRNAPKNSEQRDRGEAAWSKIENFSLAYPQGGHCRVFSEPILLLYLAAAHDWNRDQGLDLCFYSSKRWIRVEAKSAGLKAFKATYLRNGQPAETSEARVIVLEASAAGEDRDRFELLGLQGNVKLFLEPESGLPLAVRGRMPWLGEVTIHLDEAELGSPAGRKPER